jgi:hypothetical protein
VVWAKAADQVRKAFVFGVTFDALTPDQAAKVKELTVREHREGLGGLQRRGR